jgi:hypothetical protein
MKCINYEWTNVTQFPFLNREVLSLWCGCTMQRKQRVGKKMNMDEWANMSKSLHLAKSLNCWHSKVDELWNVNKALNCNLKLLVLQETIFWIHDLQTLNFSPSHPWSNHQSYPGPTLMCKCVPYIEACCKYL